MTFIQVHQLTQLAAEASDAEHRQDHFNETADNELCGVQSEIRDDPGHKPRFDDEEIRRALDYIGADEETQETLREYGGIKCFDEIIILKMNTELKRTCHLHKCTN